VWDTIWPYLAAILPTIGVSILFYYIIKNLVEADRRERIAQAQWERDRSHITDSDKGQTGAEGSRLPGEN
jgi:hypothetical protein